MYSDTEMDALDVFAILDAQEDLYCIGDSQTLTPSEGPPLDHTHSPLLEDVDIPDSPNSICILPDDFYIPDIPNPYPLSPDDIPASSNPHTIPESPNATDPLQNLMDVCSIPSRPRSIVSSPQTEAGPSNIEPPRERESAAERSFKTLTRNLLPYLPVLLTRTSLLRAQLTQLIMERDMTVSYLDGSVTKILEIDRYLHGLRALQLIRGEEVRDQEGDAEAVE